MIKTLPMDVTRLREVLEYCPDTGIVTRKHNTLTRRNAGMPIGNISRKGYLNAKVDGVSLLVHRIAYALYYGIDPGDQLVDHIDGDRSNNRISNLRLCSNSQNMMNRRSVPSHSTTGLRGVHFSKKEKKYIAHIKVGGKLCRLGMFETPIEASECASTARKIFYGDFAGKDR